MKSVGLVLVALFLGCTITVKPLPAPTSKKRHHSLTHHHRGNSSPGKPMPTEQMQTVDAEWMANYKHLESEFDHSIPADDKIRATGTKFSVPQGVIDHFGDMIRAVHPAPY